MERVINEHCHAWTCTKRVIKQTDQTTTKTVLLKDKNIFHTDMHEENPFHVAFQCSTAFFKRQKATT